MKLVHKYLSATAGVLGCVAVMAAPVLAANARVCWEAEKVVSTQSPLRKAPPAAAGESVRGGFSGQGYLDIPWDRNKTKGVGQAVYKVRAKTPGLYYLWARTYWANGCGNSVGISVNGGPLLIVGEDGTYDQWHWVGGKHRVQLKAGINTVVLKNRETGVCVDQVFLSQDPDYVPTGKRKPTQ